MNIIVCLKQVPDTEEEKLRLNPDGKTLVREGLTSAMNDFDSYALEAAARLKDKAPDTNIIVLSLGPAQAKAVLKEGLSVAADKAYQVTDASFAGSDAAATSHVLAEAVKKIQETIGRIDAIFCGRQSIDGETSAVGAGLAELLGIPQVTGCLEAALDENSLIVDKPIKGGVQRIKAPLPCLISFAKPAWTMRYSNIKRKLAANRAVIPVLSLEDLPAIDRSRLGPEGAQIKLKAVQVPEKKKGALLIAEETPEKSAEKLCQLLSTTGII